MAPLGTGSFHGFLGGNFAPLDLAS
eukprot:COSAG01_NODE_11170_length_1991_cov_1.053383_1_plen_24_part_10